MLPAPALPPPVAEVLLAVRRLAAAAADHSGPQSASERAAWLVGLQQVKDAADAAFTYTLADFDAAGDGQTLHAAASTRAWLRGAIGMAGGEASERVGIARACRAELTAPVTALTADPCEGNLGAAEQPEGHLSYGHVRSIHRTACSLPPSTRPEGVSVLTELGTHLGVDDLRAAGRHLQHVVDPDGSVRHAEEDYGRRWLTLAPLLDGMHSIDGILDAETAASLTAALAPFLVPTGADDDRTTDQRRADGLGAIVTIAVRAAKLPTLSGATTALQVQVPLATLTGHSHQPAQLTGTSASPVWLTPPTVGRLACDATVHRIVLDPAGIPLNLGREVRLFTSAQRKALSARDRGCRFPGCCLPARYTDAHHLLPWAQGGNSDLANGLLLCRHHHRRVHEGAWTIQATSEAAGANGPLTFTHPHGQAYPSPLPQRTPDATGADPPRPEAA